MESIETELIDDGSKRDRRGRRIMRAQEREEHISRYRESGMTQKAYCEREGLNYYTFISWLGKRGSKKTEKKPVFKELILGGGQGSRSDLEVVLPDGIQLRGGDAGELAKLIGLLRS